MPRLVSARADSRPSPDEVLVITQTLPDRSRPSHDLQGAAGLGHAGVSFHSGTTTLASHSSVPLTDFHIRLIGSLGVLLGDRDVVRA